MNNLKKRKKHMVMAVKFYDQVIHGIDMNPEIRDINLGAPKFNVKLETDGAHNSVLWT